MNWRRLAKRLLLLDQQISLREAEILREEILADHVVDKDELAFLLEVRREARIVNPEFDTFFFQVLKKVALADGVVSDDEAAWLRKIFFSDNFISPAETRFLEELQREAKSVGPAFRELVKDALHAPDWSDR